MKYQDLIDLIEEKKETKKVQGLKNTLRNHLKRLDSKAHLSKGMTYYYLLHVILQSHTLFETLQCKRNYRKMCEFFEKEEKKLIELVKKRKKITKKLKEELNEFYKLMERSFATLQVLYDKKDFLEKAQDAYEMKMMYRKKKFWYKKKYWNWFEYAFLEKSCKYGHSFFRWGLTSLLFALGMACFYAFIDFIMPSSRIIPESAHWYDYIYFSITTLTSLGYGDLVPVSFVSKFFATAEVFFGFIMLGIFITLIQKKM